MFLTFSFRRVTAKRFLESRILTPYVNHSPVAYLARFQTTLLGIKYAVPFMQTGGTIINIASVASLVGGYGSHAYTAAKFGVVGLAKSVALELAKRGIGVNAICVDGTASWIWAPVFPEMPPNVFDRVSESGNGSADPTMPLAEAGFTSVS